MSRTVTVMFLASAFVAAGAPIAVAGPPPEITNVTTVPAPISITSPSAAASTAAWIEG